MQCTTQSAVTICDIMITIVLTLFFMSKFCAASSSTFYVTEKGQTWRESAEECRNRYGGYLVGARDSLFQNVEKLKTIIRTETVWTGNYKSFQSNTTAWLEFKGCFNVSGLDGYKTEKTRIYDCFKTCKTNGLYIGSNRQYCFCVRRNSLRINKNRLTMDHCSIDIDGIMFGYTNTTAAMYKVYLYNLRSLCEVMYECRNSNKRVFICKENDWINSLNGYNCSDGQGLTFTEVNKHCVHRGYSMIAQKENRSCAKTNNFIYNRRYDEISDSSYGFPYKSSEMELCQIVSVGDALLSDYVECDDRNSRYKGLCKGNITFQGKITEHPPLTRKYHSHKNLTSPLSTAMASKSQKPSATAEQFPTSSSTTSTTTTSTTTTSAATTSTTTTSAAMTSTTTTSAAMTSTTTTSAAMTSTTTILATKSLPSKKITQAIRTTELVTTIGTTNYKERLTCLKKTETEEDYTNYDITQFVMTTTISFDNTSDNTFFNMTNIIIGIVIIAITLSGTSFLIILIFCRKCKRKRERFGDGGNAESITTNSLQNKSCLRRANTVTNGQDKHISDHNLQNGQEDHYHEIGEVNIAIQKASEKIYSTSSDYVYHELNRHRKQDVACVNEYSTFVECGEQDGIYKSNVSRSARHQETSIDDVYDSAAKVAERAEGIYERSYHSKQYSD